MLPLLSHHQISEPIGTLLGWMTWLHVSNHASTWGRGGSWHYFLAHFSTWGQVRTRGQAYAPVCRLHIRPGPWIDKVSTTRLWYSLGSGGRPGFHFLISGLFLYYVQWLFHVKYRNRLWNPGYLSNHQFISKGCHKQWRQRASKKSLNPLL